LEHQKRREMAKNVALRKETIKLDRIEVRLKRMRTIPMNLISRIAWVKM